MQNIELLKNGFPRGPKIQNQTLDTKHIKKIYSKSATIWMGTVQTPGTVARLLFIVSFQNVFAAKPCAQLGQMSKPLKVTKDITHT